MSKLTISRRSYTIKDFLKNSCLVYFLKIIKFVAIEYLTLTIILSTTIGFSEYISNKSTVEDHGVTIYKNTLKEPFLLF